MKRSDFKKWVLSAFLVQAVACTKSKDSASSQTSAPQIPQHYSTNLYGQDGSIIGRLNQDMKDSDVQSKNRRGAQETTLFAVPGVADFNTQVFRLLGVTDVTGVYTAPKLMVLSNQGSSLMERNSDGTTTIPLMLAVVDGIRDQIPDPAAQDHVRPVPDIFRVKKQNGELGVDELEAKMKRMYGAETQIDSLPGCPATISISDGHNSFDVTPVEFKTSDYCQMNSPFVVSVRLPDGIASEWMTKILPAGYLTAYMRYQVEAPSVIGKISIHFDRSKFFEEIKSNLHGNYKGFAQGDVQVAIRKVIESNRANITVVGNINELEKQIIEKAINEFFTPFIASPELPAAPACNAMACLQVSYVKDTQNSEFSIEYAETAAVRIPQFIEAHTSLAPAGMKTNNIGQDPNNIEGSQLFQNDGVIYHSGLTALRGSIIKFTPKDLQREERNRKQEVLAYTNSGRECVHHLPGVPFGGPGPCDAWQDHHTYIYTQEFSPANWVRILNPLSSTIDMMNQMSVVFTAKSGRTSTCSLSSLMTQGDGKTVQLLVDSSNYCKIESDGNDQELQVSFVNNIVLPAEVYMTGTRVDSVNEGVPSSNTYAPVKYSPMIKLFGEVSVQSGITSAGAVSGVGR